MYRREESSYVRKDEQRRSTAPSDDDFLPFEGDNLPSGTPKSSSSGREKNDLKNDFKKKKKKDCWDLPPLEEEKLVKAEKYEGGKWAKYVEGKDPRELPIWMLEKAAAEKKYGKEGWSPLRKLSPEALEGIRTLHAQHPDEYTTEKLSDLFEVSPEAIKRILKSKWRPNPDQAIARQEAWERRYRTIWENKVAAGEIVTKSMKKKAREAREVREAREKWGFSGVSGKFL
jgi:hypothetical protein